MGWFEQGEAAYQGFVESEVDVFLFFFEQESFLEGEHAFVSSKAEHADDFLQVESHAYAVLRGHGFESGFLKVEDLGIVLSVLDGILPVVSGADLHFAEYGHIDLQGDVELPGIDDPEYRKLLRAFSEVAEPDRIGFGNAELVEAVGVGGGSSAGAALYAHGFHRIISGAIEHVSLDRIFLREELTAPDDQ